MYCTHRRSLDRAVRTIIHTVRFVTVMVMVAGVFGMFETFGGVVRASEKSEESEAAEANGGIARSCSEVVGDRHQLRVRLVPAKGVGARMVETVQVEVEELWRTYGVDVLWEDAWKEGDTGPKPDLFVFFVDRELDMGASRDRTAVAWILFVEGSPRPLINLSVAAAQRLLDATPWLDERPTRYAPISIQERLVATMIGRALAHEIGHYLLASSKHAQKGLMKPLITPAEFVKQGRKHLQLMPDDVRELRTARLADCQLSASR
jgi:hypothetical protein